MKAKFYLHPESIAFKDNVMSPEEYRQRWSTLICDIRMILRDKTEQNVLVSTEDFFNGMPIFNGQPVYQYICGPSFTNDESTWLYEVLDQTQTEEFSPQEIEKASFFNEQEEKALKECKALIVINEVEQKETALAERNREYITFDKYAIVYDRRSWLYVRRQILGNHPESAESFFNRCKAYFPNITFSEHCLNSLSERCDGMGDEYWRFIPHRVVYYLSCINDRFMDFMKAKYSNGGNQADKEPDGNLMNALEEFSGVYNFDRVASPQGNPKKKENYTFSFELPTIEGGKEHMSVISINCGPHLKIEYIDSQYCSKGKMDTNNVHPRIYLTVHNGQIMVGHIGRHL